MGRPASHVVGIAVWSWIVDSAPALLGSLCAVQAIWSAKKSRRWKAVETARAAIELRRKLEWELTMKSLKGEADGVPARLERWDREMRDADRELQSLRSTRREPTR